MDIIAIFVCYLAGCYNGIGMRYNVSMDERSIKKARDYVRLRPYLVWSTKNYDGLSPEFIVESILNYGDWNDFLFIKDLFGVKNLNEIFEKILKKRRVNLRPQTINYFKIFFNKYA